MAHHTMVEGTGLGQAAAAATTQLDIQNEAVLPRLETLRQQPSVSDTVLNLLGACEEQARTSSQGRQPRKSGRYSVDIFSGYVRQITQIKSETCADSITRECVLMILVTATIRTSVISVRNKGKQLHIWSISVSSSLNSQ